MERLAAQPDSVELEAYVDVRRSQGVNGLLTNTAEHQYADRDPRNAYGEAPFLRRLTGGAEDLTPYWAHLEWIVEEAEEREMLIFLVSAYLGLGHGESGGAAELLANGPERLRAYGDCLGRRLGELENVIWMKGGDAPPPSWASGTSTPTWTP